MKNLDTPPTRCTVRYNGQERHNDLLCGIRRFRLTGYGIDPNQPALRHTATLRDDCRCHWCAGTPIETTEPIRWPK